MKAHGHTKTLFIQAGKYKWSYKHDHCIDCGLVKFKHKGRGLCTSCWDKKRDRDPHRKEIKYQAGMKWHKINKPRKPREEWKPMGPKAFLTPEDKKAYHRLWYQKWKEAIIILNKGRIWKSKGKLLAEYKGYPIPFEIGPREEAESYESYKERMRKFTIVCNYINK